MRCQEHVSLWKSYPKCSCSHLLLGQMDRVCKREQATSNINTFRSNRNIDLEESERDLVRGETESKKRVKHRE